MESRLSGWGEAILCACEIAEGGFFRMAGLVVHHDLTAFHRGDEVPGFLLRPEQPREKYR